GSSLIARITARRQRTPGTAVASRIPAMAPGVERKKERTTTRARLRAAEAVTRTLSWVIRPSPCRALVKRTMGPDNAVIPIPRARNDASRESGRSGDASSTTKIEMRPVPRLAPAVKCQAVRRVDEPASWEFASPEMNFLKAEGIPKFPTAEVRLVTARTR